MVGESLLVAIACICIAWKSLEWLENKISSMNHNMLREVIKIKLEKSGQADCLGGHPPPA